MFPSKDQSVVVAKDLRFVLPSGEVLFSSVDIAVSKGDKIVIVGENGVGKSTLMKVIAGILPPSAGSITSHKSAYVDQIDEGVGDRGNMNVLDLLSTENEDWWQLQIHYERLFSSPLPDLSRNLRQLSGGEYTRLKIAIATYDDPELLLLDEPTNHLDLYSKRILSDFITGFAGAVIVISHDIDFINHISRGIWEIESGSLTFHGGNYTDYLHSKSQKDASRQKKLAEALNSLEKTEWSLIKEDKRSARSKKIGVVSARNRSMSASDKGFFKDKSTAASGRKREILYHNLTKAREEVKVSTVPKKKIAKLDLYEGENKKGRSLIEVRQGKLMVGNEVLIRDINLEVKFGERVLLMGDNGSGKTSLIKSLLQDTSDNITLSGAHIFRAQSLLGMYINQRYDQIDRSKSLIQNIYSVNPNLDIQVARRALGNLLFREEHDIDKPANTLSGGEIVRLAFAMASVSPSDLLVLDEPTNNLDTATIDVVVSALSQFTGAVLVVSHNLNFLKRIGITKSFKIQDGKLSQMRYTPTEDGFYKEIEA